MRPRRSVHVLAQLEQRRFDELALSFYAPVQRGAGQAYFSAQLKDLVRAGEHKLDQREVAGIRRELPRVVAALSKQRFESASIAVFSGEGLLSIWRLPDPERARIAVAPGLDLAPIRRQLHGHPPALAVVLDKQVARFYGVVLAEIEELERREGIAISRHHQGGWSATGLQRREDEHMRLNEAAVAETIDRLVARDGYERLVLAGPPEALSELRRHLGESARVLLTGAGALPAYADGNELRRGVFDLLKAS